MLLRSVRSQIAYQTQLDGFLEHVQHFLYDGEVSRSVGVHDDPLGFRIGEHHLELTDGHAGPDVQNDDLVRHG